MELEFLKRGGEGWEWWFGGGYSVRVEVLFGENGGIDCLVIYCVHIRKISNGKGKGKGKEKEKEKETKGKASKESRLDSTSLRLID